MKRIVASVGLVALGAVGVQAQSPIAAPAAKWWSVSATVRGFYDDNVNTLPNPTRNDRVWGYEASPKVGVSFGNEQTTFIAGYAYSFMYYDHKPLGNTEKFDQNHTFNAALNHAFNERYSIHVRDAFVIGQEPDALRAGNAFSTPFRVSGNNIVNSGGITFNAELTPLFGIEVGYDNAWYDYRDSFTAAGFVPGITATKNVGLTGAISASRSGALDRIVQTPHIEGRWHVMPETVMRLGYEYGQVDYTANEPIQGTFPAPFVRSQIRDNRSHTAYVGVDHSFRPDLIGSIQAGATYYDYYNLNNTSFGPSARASLTYTYAPESTLQIGFQEGRTTTDLTSDPSSGQFIKDTETSVAFASLYHRIVPRLYGSLKGTFQNATFNGGGSGIDGKSDRFFEFGADLEYKFSANFSAHAGYDYDKLESDIRGRHYDRNKVYVGATAGF
jgi:hypothetical protein